MFNMVNFCTNRSTSEERSIRRLYNYPISAKSLGEMLRRHSSEMNIVETDVRCFLNRSKASDLSTCFHQFRTTSSRSISHHFVCSLTHTKKTAKRKTRENSASESLIFIMNFEKRIPLEREREMKLISFTS